MIEICKALKAVGFPQELKFGDWYYDEKTGRRMLYIGEEKEDYEKYYYQPTLDTLWDWCREQGYAIKLSDKNYKNEPAHYRAYLYSNWMDEIARPDAIGCGETRFEALTLAILKAKGEK